MLVGDVSAQLDLVVEFFFTFVAYVVRYYYVRFSFVSIEVDLVPRLRRFD